MSRFWKEKLDNQKHSDHMKGAEIGGRPITSPHDNVLERWVYFVCVCSFTFQFQSIEQIQECLNYFEKKIHPSSAEPNVTLEHYWQSWEQRLPYRLFENSKRLKIIKALKTALTEFEK